MTYTGKGFDMYANNEVGPPSPGEGNEARRILKNTPAFVERMFRQGYGEVR